LQTCSRTKEQVANLFPHKILKFGTWAGRGLQPRPQRFIETAAQRKRSETGCKPVPAQGEQVANLFPLWAGRGLQPRPQRFIETAAQRKRSETGCKPVPAQKQVANLFPHNGQDGVCNPVRNVLLKRRLSENVRKQVANLFPHKKLVRRTHPT
jgi:hypothetical protein